MEDHPLNQFAVHKPRSLEIFSEVQKLDSLRFQSFELHASFFQQIVGLVDNFLLVDIEFKVELPCTNRVGHIAFFVGDG